MKFIISKELYERIARKVGGWIYKDCTDILQDKLKVEHVKWYKLNKDLRNRVKECVNSYKGVDFADRSLYIRLTGGGLVVYKKANILSIKDWKFWIWKDKEDIRVDDKDIGCCCEINLKEPSMEFIGNLLRFYFEGDDRAVVWVVCGKGKIYCSVVEITFPIMKYPDELEEAIVIGYIWAKKRRILERLKEKYGIDEYRLSINDHWEAARKVYKDLQYAIKNNIERVLMCSRVNIYDLIQIGYDYYFQCEVEVPKERKVKCDYELDLWYARGYYDWVVEGEVGEERIEIGIDEDFVDDLQENPYDSLDIFKKYRVKLDDLRIVKYLKMIPTDIKVKLEDIPHFKWALETVIKKAKPVGNIDDN